MIKMPVHEKIAELIKASGLPVSETLPELLDALRMGRNAVLEAPAGAGKTTLVPLALLDEGWLEGSRILVLEPRRLAARAAAARMAELLGEEVGERVGYRTRLDSAIGPKTRIEVVTEGILTRLLQADPSLDGTGIVIFDEFHERSIHADLGLALSLESQSLFREDLRLLVMSATLDGKEVADLLGDAPIIKSFGRAYPVEVRYEAPSRPGRASADTVRDIVSKSIAATYKALKEGTGSVLVFLPGAGEIKRVEAGLRERGLPDSVDLVPLYGELKKEAQDQAIRPSIPGRKKAVLATSIAETSITIEGVDTVIDSGLKRVSRFSPSTGMSGLETTRVTRDSADQRCGRAGRLGPGVCIRLWTEAEHAALMEKASPEILEADLATLALELALWGVAKPGELKWLDEPREAAYSQAKELLAHLGALDNSGKITAHGRELSRLPVHPRLGHMALKASSMGLGGVACHLAAFLTERDFLKSEAGKKDHDIGHRLDYLTGRAPFGSAEIDRAAFERVRQAAKRMIKDLKAAPGGDDTEMTGVLLAFAYPDRIGKRRATGEGRYLLSNGRGASLSDGALTDEYIVAASLDQGGKESRIFLAAPITEAHLNEYFSGLIESVDVVQWDAEQGAVVAERHRRLWELVLSSAPLKDPPKASVIDALLYGIKTKGLQVLPWDRKSTALRARVNFLNRLSDEIGASLPEMTDERLIEGLKDWLGPWIEGMTRLEHLKKLDMNEALLGMLSWEDRKRIEKLAPTHMEVPSGSRIAIDYTGERPVLSVRLQEMFGLSKTPSVVEGRAPLVIHLLSPAGRPVQVTEDLAGFWASTYQLVRKEMKGRYPRHYWPEDPMRSEPTRGIKKRK